jgi:hypothetical protein
MILSDPVPFAFRGKPALMVVVRNNGNCWGELRCGETRFSVSTRSDQYERTDEDAARAFIRAAHNPSKLSPSLLVSA